MESIDMEAQLNKFCDSLKIRHDFKDVITSSEYKLLGLNYTGSPDYILLHKHFSLAGDIRSINISAFNHVSMAVTISNKSDSLCKTLEVRVDVPSHLKDEVLKLKPDTGVVLNVKYTGINVMAYTFELEEIIECDKELYFAYCVCSNTDGCKYISGYSESDYTKYCPLCGAKTKFIKNVY